MKKKITLVSYIFGLIGLVFFSGSLYSYLDQQAFLKRAEKVQGTVIELIVNRSNNSTTFTPVVFFTTKDGKEIEFTSSISSNPPSYNQGESVEMVYDPTNPSDATINAFSSLYMGPLIFGIFGLVFFLVGFSIILFGYLKKKKAKYLLETGKRISTKFKSVEINYALEVNNRNPFQIISQWIDPTTNQLYIFESDSIWFDPTDFIKTEEIAVMIDPENPKKYHMDISFLPERGN
ncbi:DUF3592 domain-containing protein [Flavobacterium sp. MC2016-06]|jgi:hypothetical protein|uniref:DUF3592 domain-containing protein n=1 Tax=Flavobacterium sp. MC2016-06 TaxID=2676308 RepID=UPI0012BA6D0C|nr:DUF3592 domain-containing protein [Flavobacterium sp. MC2016-06]MBU3860847.1 DUF3592 domain-containing protein [Flavobacterium sp. MC2016-06]